MSLKTYIDFAKTLPPLKTGVVHPVTPEVLLGALEAEKEGLIKLVLIGPSYKIKQAAAEAKIDITNHIIIDTPHSHAAAETAAALAKEGQLQMLMKGSLHTAEFLKAIIQFKLTTDRFISHAFFLEVASYAKPLILSDAAINIAPDLNIKKDIVQNAIDFALNLSIEKPKVALLAAVETIDAKMPATIDAAALCKMAERGQINGGTLDGPLALDTVISAQAAKAKGIHSLVTEDVDILIVPNLEAGNMLGKQLEYMKGTQAAGVVLGAAIPLVLTSRSEQTSARVASCALAKISIRKNI